MNLSFRVLCFHDTCISWFHLLFFTLGELLCDVLWGTLFLFLTSIHSVVRTSISLVLQRISVQSLSILSWFPLGSSGPPLLLLRALSPVGVSQTVPSRPLDPNPLPGTTSPIFCPAVTLSILSYFEGFHPHPLSPFLAFPSPFFFFAAATFPLVFSGSSLTNFSHAQFLFQPWRCICSPRCSRPRGQIIQGDHLPSAESSVYSGGLISLHIPSPFPVVSCTLHQPLSLHILLPWWTTHFSC